MSASPNPIATEHLPFFLAGPGQTDGLLIAVVCILITVVMLVGVFYFTLHSLPERMTHGANAGKFQLVGVLSLVALFTHNNAFWIAALLIAAVRLPDFLTPIRSLARSMKNQSNTIRHWTEKPANDVATETSEQEG